MQVSIEPLQSRLDRLRANVRTIIQATLAATVAYWLAADVLEHPNAFFAPIAAIVVVAVSLEDRWRRAVQLVAGVSVGVLLADLIIAQIGSGLWQLALVLVAAMAAAVLVGGGRVILVQAASSAVLIATLQPPTDAQPLYFTRFIDALIGGLIGLLSTALLPSHPLRLARRAVDPVLAEAEAVLRDLADALDAGDTERTTKALLRARRSSELVAAMHSNLGASREIVWVSPARWHSRSQLGRYLAAAPHVDNAMRNLRVLARQAVASMRRKELRPPELAELFRQLADALRLLGIALDNGGDTAGDAVTKAALGTVRLSEDALSHTAGLSSTVMVAQSRAMASDVLQAVGMPYDEALKVMKSVPMRSTQPAPKSAPS